MQGSALAAYADWKITSELPAEIKEE